MPKFTIEVRSTVTGINIELWEVEAETLEEAQDLALIEEGVITSKLRLETKETCRELNDPLEVEDE